MRASQNGHPTVEGPYALPRKWSWVRLGEIHTIITGSTPSRGTADYFGGETPFVKPSDLEQGRELLTSTESLSDLGKSQARLIPAGATLLSCIGLIGKSAYACVPVTTNQQITSLIPNERVYPLYTYYFTRSPIFQQMLREQVATTTIAIVNKRKLSMIPFPLPPKAEQMAIVRRIEQSLDKLQQAKQLLEDAVQLLTQYRVSVLDQVFARQQAEIPSGWRQIPLKELVRELKTGLVRPQAKQSDQHPYRYIKMNNITPAGELDLTELVRVEATEQEVVDYQLAPGDFLLNNRNSRELVGKCAIYTGESDTPILFNNNLIRIRFVEQVESRYVHGYFLASMGQTQLQRIKSATTNVAAIYIKQLLRLPILLPPIQVQRQMIEEWDQLNSHYRKGLSFIPKRGEITAIEQAILREAFGGY